MLVWGALFQVLKSVEAMFPALRGGVQYLRWKDFRQEVRQLPTSFPLFLFFRPGEDAVRVVGMMTLRLMVMGLGRLL